MKHYHCDGCGIEIPEAIKDRFTWTLLDAQGMVVETLDVCKKCNKIVTDAIEKARKRTGQ